MEESRLQKIETGHLMRDIQRKSCAKRENRRSKMSYFPMFIDIEGKHILVVGAGKIALRRVQTLLQFRARIKVIAKEIPKEQKEAFHLLVSEGKIVLEEKAFEESDLTEALFLVLAATNVKKLNHEICMLCRKRKILANTATDRTDCDFYFPAVAVQEELVVGITGDGSDHRKVAETAARIRKVLEMEHEEKNQSRQQRE